MSIKELLNINILKEIEESKLLRFAVDQIPLTVMVTDILGNIEFVNTKFTELTGYSKSDVIGKNANILNSGFQDKDYYNNLWHVINSGEIWKGRFRNKKRDGSFYWENVTIVPTCDTESKISHFIGIKEDITEVVEKEEQNLLLNEVVEYDKSLENYKKLTKVFTHDFNNLMNGIINLTDLLSNTQIGLDDKGKKYLSLLQTTVSKAENTLLSFNSLDDIIEPNLSKINIDLILKQYSNIHKNKKK